MKITISSSLLTGVTAITLLLGACSKKADSIATPGTGTDPRAVTACTLKDTVVNSTGTSFSYYTAWAPKTVTLAGGTGPVVQWEGYSNSFVRPVTGGFYIGTMAAADTCSAWSVVKNKITVKNANLGVAPDTTGYSKYNVVGVNGTFSGVNFGLGYYHYVTGVPTVDSVIVIWKDSHSTSSSYVSVPSALTGTPEAYIINVRSFAVGGTSGAYTDAVSYAYKKI
ncbi:hypothetical protein GA0116948_10848 [Chitinophaga costaii]|uniref:Lipoprotein n=1 Tax=Chitinophaga costaii TaxID=1335309 RepID=A0A1C4EEE3_9BACT|nr:hypothetical protein [Chitinophaga costaii]PUZ23878.1 hypothetical protein DCM91_13890 [Chitinophaga costaii]SCC41968.1 hypothetical protein GA0116948_10848 [Chitinophaga costaii]